MSPPLAIFGGSQEEYEALKAAFRHNCSACQQDHYGVCSEHRRLLTTDQRLLNLWVGERGDRNRMLMEEWKP